jgi:hypothetical protein
MKDSWIWNRLTAADRIGIRTPLYWLGASSFEGRALGSLTSLQAAGCQVLGCTALEYGTAVTPRELGERQRAYNRRQLREMQPHNLTFTRVHPYRYYEFLRVFAELQEQLRHKPDVHMVVDVTCLTRVHTLALVYYLEAEGSVCDVTLAYSRPEMYGSPTRNIWSKRDWTTVLLSRLDVDSTHRHSGSDAIVLLGHEGDRVRLALNELTAVNALVVKADDVMPPGDDAVATSEIQNARLLADIQKGILPYTLVTIGIEDADVLVREISTFARDARDEGHRLVLCPFGPKPLVVAAAAAALRAYSEAVWMSYPVPASYDAEYTLGYRDTMWFEYPAVRSATGLFDYSL